MVLDLQEIDTFGPQGLHVFRKALDAEAQVALRESLAVILAEAPPFIPHLPRTGRPMSVRMSNCGPLGWVSDQAGGYRYQAHHPETRRPWPPMPACLLALWDQYAGYSAPPEAGLINLYDAKAKLGLHVDADEEDRSAPVLSVSLGDEAVFRIGGLSRHDPTRTLRLQSGDVPVLGGLARACHHGIDRVVSGTSGLWPGGGRVNVTLRRVTRPERQVS